MSKCPTGFSCIWYSFPKYYLLTPLLLWKIILCHIWVLIFRFCIVVHGFLFLCQYCPVLVTVVQYINTVLGSIFLRQGLNSVSMSVPGLCWSCWHQTHRDLPASASECCDYAPSLLAFFEIKHYEPHHFVLFKNWLGCLGHFEFCVNFRKTISFFYKKHCSDFDKNCI